MKKNIFWFLTVIFVGACSTYVDVDFDSETYERELEAWKEAKITKYEYTYEMHGDGGGFYNVSVDGNKCEVTDKITGETYINNDYRIEKIYEDIKSHYDWSQGTEINSCDSLYFYYSEIIVQYDTVNHIPLTISYIYEVPENLAVDGTFYYKITDFKITE
ncbi:MAG: hypothetical protein II220_04835 [Spirochaetales bacterium]|nr:hypothetical protein [Spirochaetales bacterium]